MPLTKPQPSLSTTKAFRIGLAELMDLGRAPTGLSTDGFPQRIYALSLNAILRGNAMKSAKPVLWEFLVTDPRGTAVLVALANPRGEREPKVTSIARHPAATETRRAILRLEGLPVVKRNPYELRRLRIPALSLGAFWLKSLAKGDDLAVPYQTIHRELRRMHPYPMEEFLSVLRLIAEKRMKHEAALRRNKKR
jgi:hypothetical protein